MRSNSARAAIGVGLIVVAVALFFALRSGDESSDEPQQASTASPQAEPETPSAQEVERPQEVAPPIPTIVVHGGEPVGGVQNLEFTQGETANFRVESDVADEIHLHGYDLSKPIAAGGTVTFTFPAEIEGVFEAELEERAVPLAEISVTPG